MPSAFRVHDRAGRREYGDPVPGALSGRHRVPQRRRPPAFTLVVRNERALRRSRAVRPRRHARGVLRRRPRHRGQPAQALAAGMEGGADRRRPGSCGCATAGTSSRTANASRGQAKRNADFHYALAPEFYRLWLDDPLMMYTCAYWKEGTRTLEEAQRNKIDHVARKMLLKPGESVVDIGCGFGGFMFRAQEHYGVHGHRRSTPPAAGRARAARDRAPRPAGKLDADARRLPRAARHSSTRWCPSAASSTPGATSSPR